MIRQKHTVWLITLGLISGGILISYTPDPDVLHKDETTDRWFTQQQVQQGGATYAQYCASCHGVQAEATPAWRKPDDQGRYPPPPLNGTAHAWHHPLPQLTDVILEGTEGGMPAWKNTLENHQVIEVIAWFQSHWPDQGYQAWIQTNKR